MSEKEYVECPYCGEEIKAIAIKCKHCGEWLDDDDEDEEEYDDEEEEEDDDELVVRGRGQNIVVKPNIVVQNNNEVRQEQNVVVTSGGGESSGGCLWTQVVIVAIGLGFAFHGFWFGVAAFILLAIAVFIPYLGPALCVILGLAFGVMAGAISAAFGAATWVAWLIGIAGAVILVMMNLEQRKSEQ